MGVTYIGSRKLNLWFIFFNYNGGSYYIINKWVYIRLLEKGKKATGTIISGIFFNVEYSSCSVEFKYSYAEHRVLKTCFINIIE